MKRYFLPLLLLAFVIRIAGVSYGLPLWLVGDETGPIFAALKMLELKTLLPALHTDVFQGILYYGPGLSYAYLFVFAVIIFGSFLASGGASFAHTADMFVVDPSVFFLTARIVAAIAGTATVYLVYRIGKQIFKNERAGLWSAVFLAFSLFHVQFSHWARHWIFITFLLTLIFFVISHPKWTPKRRYILAGIFVGLGTWISVNALFGGAIVILWYFFRERRSLFRDVRERWFLFALGGGLLSIVIGYLLWPPSFGFLAGITGVGEIARTAPSVTGFFSGLFRYIVNIATFDPLLFLFACSGGFLLFRKRDSMAIVSTVFIMMYLVLLYIFFFFIDRYILVLYPFLALFAGYGAYRFFLWLQSRLPSIGRRLVVVCLIAMLAIPPLRLDWLLLYRDTRLLAWDSIAESASEDARIATAVPLFHLPPTRDAILEFEQIDSTLLRSADRVILEAEEDIPPPRGRAYHAFNFSVADGDTFSYLLTRIQDYDYLVIATEDTARYRSIKPEIPRAAIKAASFVGSGYFSEANGNQDIPEGFGGGLVEVLTAGAIGPDITIFAL